jgi:hypothetical protein
MDLGMDFELSFGNATEPKSEAVADGDRETVW